MPKQEYSFTCNQCEEYLTKCIDSRLVLDEELRAYVRRRRYRCPRGHTSSTVEVTEAALNELLEVKRELKGIRKTLSAAVFAAE